MMCGRESKPDFKFLPGTGSRLKAFFSHEAFGQKKLAVFLTVKDFHFMVEPDQTDDKVQVKIAREGGGACTLTRRPLSPRRPPRAALQHLRAARPPTHHNLPATSASVVAATNTAAILGAELAWLGPAESRRRSDARSRCSLGSGHLLLHLASHMGLEASELDLHGWASSSLPTEPSLQPTTCSKLTQRADFMEIFADLAPECSQCQWPNIAVHKHSLV
ncbi:uncharacterized protein LOC127187057 [Acomys russatus]|uniref:uncharacterized protein LOC127187057 n=1 Tax=Acomys russatus TaxID=60746 RepID=UPI0021E2B792|nr:uncharacterized protein LOC127187057 [Acomys russatus]